MVPEVETRKGLTRRGHCCYRPPATEEITHHPLKRCYTQDACSGTLQNRRAFSTSSTDRQRMYQACTSLNACAIMRCGTDCEPLGAFSSMPMTLGPWSMIRMSGNPGFNPIAFSLAPLIFPPPPAGNAVHKVGGRRAASRNWATLRCSCSSLTGRASALVPEPSQKGWLDLW